MLGMMVCSATAETIGWGFVNDTDVALRRGMGGERIARLPKDTCVWINNSRTDSEGVLWYEIKTGLHENYANYDYSGWMKAEFVDAGDAVWHDVTEIAASENGLIVLRADGSTETAGRPVVAMDASGWVSPKGWAAPFGRAIHVGIPFVGNQYHIVTENDEFISSGNGVRIAEGLTKAASLEYDDEMYDEAMLPLWRHDAEIAAFRSGYIIDPVSGLATVQFIGIKTDGSLIAEPAEAVEQLAGWSGIVDLRISGNFILGLKKDGTVLLASFGEVIPDVSAWKDIIAIGAGIDWCVGLEQDGTLVFAGDHTFMNEGHVRK
jgi:hypothetical protein